jgi:ABC transport system ATP-binding/permease protein
MSLIRLRNICLNYGGPELLNKVQFSLDKGERVCLIGRNGQGKSTFLNVLAKTIEPDAGEVEYQQGLNVAVLPQSVPGYEDKSVFAVVVDGLGEVGQLMLDYHEICQRAEVAPDDTAIHQRLSHLQASLDQHHAWGQNTQVEKVISLLKLTADDHFGQLSGGLKRRVLLAQALVDEPDVLLLDEPTNHLDIDAIAWLENFLLQYKGTLIFVTHDREFLQRLATRIIELDLGELTSWPGDYKTYLGKKAMALLAREKEQANFDKKLAQEEVWIRQGIKARRTRDEGRVRKLEAMRKTRSERPSVVGNAALRTQDVKRSGRLVVDAKAMSYHYDNDNQLIINDFSTRIVRGDKIGIIGPNGCGKTTLLNLLLGELKPTVGSVRLGTQLEIAYVDQLRGQLDDNKSVLDNLAQGRSHIEFNGGSQHALGYLSRFLFSPQQSRSAVRSLSGGEKNRLLLAKILSKPSNILVLDEPTNDLDLETLALLESMLVDYSGTLLLVSHDRAFLNNVATSTMVFEGDGRIAEYVGGYDDWLRQRPKPATVEKKVKPKIIKPKDPQKARRELNQLPQKIEKLEKAVERLHEAMSAPGFYQQAPSEIEKKTSELAALEKKREEAYQRWDELEKLLTD